MRYNFHHIGYCMTKKIVDLPNRIREHRKDQKLTLVQLGGLTKMHTGYLSKMELGERPTNLGHLRNIAKQLGLSPGDLLTPTDNPNSLSVDERRIIELMRRDRYFAHIVRHLIAAKSEFDESD